MPRNRTPDPLVRYVSPFGSPAWMPRHRAEVWMRRDDALYVELSRAGALSEAQQAVGAPRIEVAR